MVKNKTMNKLAVNFTFHKVASALWFYKLKEKNYFNYKLYQQQIVFFLFPIGYFTFNLNIAS